MVGTTVKTVTDKDGEQHLIHFHARIYAAICSSTNAIWICSAYDRFGRLSDDDSTWEAETINKKKWDTWRGFRDKFPKLQVGGNLLPVDEHGRIWTPDHELPRSIDEAGVRARLALAGAEGRG